MCKYTAIVAIVIIELFALSHGVNGIGLSLSIGGVGVIAGYDIRKGKEILKDIIETKKDNDTFDVMK